MAITGLMDPLFKNVYSDAEPHKFADQLKKIVEFFDAKNGLDYGSGGSDLNKTKLDSGEKFIDYIGLKKIHSFEPARNKKENTNLMLFYALMFLNMYL